jgi:hypothetical protein
MKSLMPILLALLLSCNKTGSAPQEQALPSIALGVEDVDPKSLVPTPSKIDFAVGESIDLSLTGLFPYRRVSVLTKGITWTSADPSVATVDGEGVTRALKPGSTQIEVSYRGVSATVPVTVNDAKAMQIILLPTVSTIDIPSEMGALQTKEFHVDTFALLTDGNLANIETDVSWDISDTTGLELISNSKFLAKRPGEYELIARYGNLHAKHKVIISAIPLAVSRLELTGANFVVRYGDRMPLPVRAIMNDKQIITQLNQATFVTSNSGISVVDGQILGGNLGKHWVRVIFGGQEITVPITVREADVTSILITPSAFPLSIGQRLSFSAVATFSNGDTLNITTAMRTSINSAGIATVNGHELLAVANGSTSLNVTYKGVTKTALVNVGNPTLSLLEIRPASFTLAAGETANFRVFGVYTDGTENDITGLVVTRGLAPSKADSLSTGVLTAKVEGTTKLSSTYVDPITSQNLTASAPVTVLPAYLQSLIFDPPSSSKALGRYEDFRVKGRYSDTTEVDITNLVNITADISSAGLSYCAGIARTNTNKIRVTGRNLGSQKIIATYNGISGEATFTATPKELDRVDIVRVDTSVGTGQVDKGNQARFIARGTFSDLSTEDITNSGGGRTVTWNPPIATQASFVNSGGQKLLTALMEGDGSFSVSVVDAVGTKSDAFALGIYVPCPSPGRRVDYFCWYLGTVSDNCTNACSAVSRGYHGATASFAGNGGTDERCRSLIQETFIDQIEASFSPPAAAPDGLGCSIYVQSGIDIGLREKTRVTTANAAQPFFRRICSCE